ncbi:hypothetical protein OESDEN_24735 [Oesophagostomum dentatum]|uniref:Uncharacterized protein n=1 Tax=Oesophagostomum dentatum TaxID=61180 RepID=A0A0B1RSM7_OESDE|nr:hypothetical protein OESDEN_24735 [Oesophagostomum dentatum]
MQYLMDSEYLVAPDDKDRIKIEIAEDEDIPDKFLLGSLSCIGNDRQSMRPIKWKSTGISALMSFRKN